MKKTCDSLYFNEICIISNGNRKKNIDMRVLVSFLLLINYDKFVFFIYFRFKT